MEHAGLLQRGKIDPAWPVSLALHLAIIAILLAFLPDVKRLSPPPEDSIDVEVVPAPPVVPPAARSAVQPPPDSHEGGVNPVAGGRAPTAPGTVPETASKEMPPSLPTLPKPLTPGPPELTQATRLFSGKTLASPRSRQARKMLATLSGSERNLQLCNLEALEQVNRSRPGSAADLVAPYAMKPEKVRGNSIEVDGGAFRSKRSWFNIRFRCEVDPAGQTVIAFAFAIGDAIPRDVWQEYNLVADDGEADQ